jgi:hypothetical protein
MSDLPRMMNKHRRRRLNKIKSAQESLEGSLLELRKDNPAQSTPGRSDVEFRWLYYVLALARKAP